LRQQWYERKQIVEEMHFVDEEDSIVWQYSSSGKYYVQTLYAIINNRGVRQVFIPVVWKVYVPS
jgi:hypothetical protein